MPQVVEDYKEIENRLEIIVNRIVPLIMRVFTHKQVVVTLVKKRIVPHREASFVRNPVLSVVASNLNLGLGEVPNGIVVEHGIWRVYRRGYFTLTEDVTMTDGLNCHIVLVLSTGSADYFRDLPELGMRRMIFVEGFEAI